MAIYGIYAIREHSIELVDSSEVEHWARHDMRQWYRGNPGVTFVLFNEDTCEELIRYSAVHA